MGMDAFFSDSGKTEEVPETDVLSVSMDDETFQILTEIRDNSRRTAEALEKMVSSIEKLSLNFPD
jgi:hypothetical protein